MVKKKSLGTVLRAEHLVGDSFFKGKNCVFTPEAVKAFYDPALSSTVTNGAGAGFFPPLIIAYYYLETNIFRNALGSLRQPQSRG